MKIKKIEAEHLKIPFKMKFSHALKSRTYTDNVIVKIYSDKYVGVGECLPRDYVTGESVNSVFGVLEKKIVPYFSKLEFKNAKETVEEIINFSKNIKKEELSAFACFSDALLNLSAQEFDFEMKDLLKFLDIRFKEKKQIKFSGIVGDSNIIKMIGKVIYIKKFGMNKIKMKITPKSFWKLRILKPFLKDFEVRVDGNGSFEITGFERTLRVLKWIGVDFFEQPFATNYKKKKQMYDLCQLYDIKVILDEDLCSFDDEKKIVGSNRVGDIPNLRISKNGGIANTLLMYKYFIEKNIDVELCCMVGETILTREEIILAKYLDVIELEGDYDKFLFDDNKKIIENPEFKEKGVLKFLHFNINQEIVLNKNVYKRLVVTKRTLWQKNEGLR